MLSEGDARRDRPVDEKGCSNPELNSPSEAQAIRVTHQAWPPIYSGGAGAT